MHCFSHYPPQQVSLRLAQIDLSVLICRKHQSNNQYCYKHCIKTVLMQALILIKSGLLSMAEHLRETISMVPDIEVYPSFNVVDMTDCVKRYE